MSPDKIFERRWAQTLLDRALGRLQEESVATGRARQFDVLRSACPNNPARVRWRRWRRHWACPDAVGVAVCRLRRRYRELIRTEIAHTVAGPAEVEDEVRWLLTVLS